MKLNRKVLNDFVKDCKKNKRIVYSQRDFVEETGIIIQCWNKSDQVYLDYGYIVNDDCQEELQFNLNLWCLTIFVDSYEFEIILGKDDNCHCESVTKYNEICTDSIVYKILPNITLLNEKLFIINE